MKNVKQTIFAMVVLLSMLLAPLTALPTKAASTVTGYTKASDVKYVTSGSYIANWGAREEDCIFLTTKAQTFYAQNSNYSYEYLSKLAGGSSQSNAPSSALYKALQSMMKGEQDYETSYNATRDLFKYTDCQLSDYSSKGAISSFYSGTGVGPNWDGGSTWNREHTWPNSKGDASGNGENDIMMLRPTSVSENSSRGNKAYGESSGFYNPNSHSGGKYDLRGDVSRIMLYVYVRWGNTSNMWGSGGVMENLDVLLKWMEADPVDTWEMGRNDATEAITGTRNAFVDYPEYAWLLFGKDAPSDYVSPSGEASDGNATGNAGQGGTVTPDPTPTPEAPAPNSTLTIAQAIALGESYAHDTTTSGKYYVTGKIASIANTTYGNMTITDESGNSIYIYGTFDATGVNRFDAMANKPAVGDTITVYGVVGNYNGPQMKNAWITSINAGSGSVTPDPDPTPGGSTTAAGTIEFGANGDEAHKDGSGIANPYTVTENGMTLVITDGEKTYSGAYDAKGNSCIKVGTGSAAGSFTFTVGEDIDKVVLLIAGYKAKVGKFTLNGTTYTTSTQSDNGEYAQYEVNTSTNKTVTLATLSGGYRIMINSILFYTGTGSGTVTPDPTPDPSTDPTPDTTLTIEEAIALGASKEHNVYTTGKYYVTGVITEVYSTQYGNMRIKDANGNILTIYGTFSADGATRYDALEVKPVAGDTVTIYGIVGQYNGTPQIKNGWITAHTPASGGDAPHTHEWSAWVTTKNATCSAEGVKTRICSCGESETESIPATGNHKWGEWVETKAPTTTAVGEETRTCSTCNKTQTREIPALVPGDCEHQWGDWVETKAPTASEAGEETRTCGLCGETQTCEVPKLDHTHTFGEWQVTTQPTCKDEGEKTRTCACGESETAVVPVTDAHSYGEWVETKAPTLEAVGEETHTCSVCGKTETREVPKLTPCEHSWGGWVVTKAPTTEEEGEVSRTCQHCGETETREVAKLTPDAPVVPDAPKGGCAAPAVADAAMVALAAAFIFIFKKRLFAR